MRRLVVEADGGSRGNPGPAAYGAVVREADTGEILVELADFLGVETNNVAEYEGVTAGLAAANEIDPSAQVEARLDSRLVVEQLSGAWAIRNARLRALALKAKSLAPPERVTFTWVPRAQNVRADALANESLDAAAAGRPARIERWHRSAGDPDVYVDAVEHTGADAATEARAGARAVREAVARAPMPVEPAAVPSAPEGSRTEQPAAEAEQPPLPRNRIVGWSVPDTGLPTRLLLVRHGVTQQSVEHRFSGFRGIDPPLIELGRQQALAAAAEVARRGGADAVVTSPLRRTRETARIVAEQLGVGEPTVVDDLAEADFGEWDSLTFAEVKQRWPDELTAWMASTDVPPPGGESFAQVRRRADRAREQLLSEFHGRRVLAVAHVTPIKALIQIVLDAPASSAFRFELAPGSLTTLAWWADGASTVYGVGESGHLHGVMHATA